jgi:hypothetical protein
VVRFLRDHARQWLEEYRFDGLRWDATAWIRNIYGGQDPANDISDGWRLMQQITGDTDARHPWKIHIAQDLRGNEWITRSSAEGGAGFDCQWDGDFVHPVRRVLTAFADGGRNMAELRDAITNRYGGDALQRVIYTESHDEVANGHRRLPEEIWPGKADDWYARKRSTLGAVLVFTAPGIPMIFQGQELLEDRWFHEQDPIDWTREHTFAGILALYRDLIALRRDRDGTTGGLRGDNVNVHHVNDARHRVPPLAQRRSGRRRHRDRQHRRSRVRQLSGRDAAGRHLAAALQQRLERLQPGLRRPRQLRHGNRGRAPRRHAVFGERRTSAVQRAHPVAGSLSAQHGVTTPAAGEFPSTRRSWSASPSTRAGAASRRNRRSGAVARASSTASRASAARSCTACAAPVT